MKGSDLLITTVIPTYKRPVLLKRAIKSVLNQTYSNFQICVYDNCSGDETREVVESFSKKDSRVKYFCHDTNIGSLKNFEFGFSRVNTPYFSFLSDDDVLFPEFYEAALKKLKEYSEAAFFGGKCVFIDQNNLLVDVRFKESKDKLIMMNESVDNFVGNDLIPWTSIIFKTEKVKNFKLDTSLKLHDVDFLYNIMYNHPIYISSKLCAVFSCLPTGASHDFQPEDYLPYVEVLLPKLKLNPTINPDSHERALQRIRAIVRDFTYVKVKIAIKKGDFLELEKLKIILRDKLHEHDLLKKIELYEKIRKHSLLWYLALLLLKSYKFCTKIFHSALKREKSSECKKTSIELEKGLALLKKLS